MPVINKEDFSAFDEALKKAPAAKSSNDDFSAFDEALKKKGGGQELKDGGQEPKTDGNPPTPLQSPSSLQEGGEKPSWQTSALNPAYSAQQAQIKKEAEPIPKPKDWKDIVLDKSSFNKPIASDATYVAKNVTGEKIEQVTKSRANMQMAIDNTTEKALKAKGLVAPKNSPAYIKQRKKVEEAVKNNDAVYTVDPTTKQPALSQTTGFWESTVNALNRAFNDEGESEEFVNNMTTQQRADYANKKREEGYELTKEGYVGKTPSPFLGKAGETIGGAVPFVTKMTEASIMATAAVMAAPETFGASLVGLAPVLSFAMTTPSMINQGGRDEVLRRFNMLKEQNPDASDVDLMSQAENGLFTGELVGGLTNLAFTAIGAKPIAQEAIPVLEKSISNTLKNTAHGTAKSAVELGTISAIGETGKEVEAGIEDKRYKLSAGEVINDAAKSFASGATAGALLHLTTQAVVGGVKLPGQLRSAIKYSLSKENPVELQAILSNNEQLGNISQGTTEAVMADLNSYNKSLEKTSQDLTPETQASVAGLIQKRDNLMSEMSSKDATQIDPYLQQIDAINNQIKGITETNDPSAYEVNDVTGQPLNGEISEAPLQKGVEGEQVGVGEVNLAESLKDVESTANAISEGMYNDTIKFDDMYDIYETVPLDYVDFEDSAQNIVAEAYHKAKADGSNPELVKAVENLLGKKETIPEQKTQTNDKENIPGLPSKVGVGKEPITTEPIKGAGAEKASAGGVLQAPGVEGEGKGVGQKVGEVDVPKQKEIEQLRAVEQEQVIKQMKPFTDKMVDIEREFKNNGYEIDTDYDNEINILDKDGEMVEPDELPDNLKKLAADYEKATSKLGEFDASAREKALAESRKVVETEAEVIEPEKVALPEQNQEQVSQQELRETENLLNDGDKIRKEGKYVKDGVEYVRNEKGLGIKSEEGGSVRFTSEPGGGGVSVPFTYKLVESETLQPSHQDGLRNPNHFIWEAQPKNRNDEGSIQAEEGFANKPRFAEMGENTNAYSGAPVVNERGEVIQGNNRSAGLRKGYQRGIETYKKSLAENAKNFGFTKEQVEGMKNPVLVREVAVSDTGAIELGNYDVKDLESGGKRRLDPVAITRRMPFELKGRIADLLFKGEGTLNQAIRDNTKRLMELINPFLNQAQRNTIFKDGELTQDGAKDLEIVAQHFLFDGGDTALPELHDNLSHTQKEGLRKSLPYIFSTGIEKSVVPEVQESIIALNDFAASKAGSFDNWLAQSDMFNNGMTPKDKYSPTAIKLAEILNDAKNQKEITTQFGKYAELVNDKPATMFDEATKGISKKEGIKQIFKTEYDESKRPTISEGGGEKISAQKEPLPQPSTEPSAAEPAKPTAAAAAEPIKPTEPTKTEAKPKVPEQTAIEKAREARKAAKEKLNAIRKGLGITPDPKKEAEALFEYHKTLVAEAKEYINAGIKSVEEWAKEVGEKVSVALQSAWDEASGKTPSTEKAEDLKYTSGDIEPRVSGVKKAITTPLREALGLPAVELPKMGTDIEELQQAKQRIDSGEVNPVFMVDDILNNDRGYRNEKEVFDMQYYAHQLDAKDRELSMQMSEADNDIDKAEIANKKQLLSDEIDRQTEAARKAGNKWGKIGYSMQPVIDTEFSMSRERNLIKEAYAGEVPQQVKEKIDIITKERDEAVAQKIKIEKDLADLKAKKEIEKKQKEAEAEQKGKPKKTREDFVKERQSLVDKIKKKWRDAKGGGNVYSSIVPIPIEKVKQLAAISPEVGELIKSHVEEGISKLDDIVTNIHDLLKDQIDGLTKKDVLDLIGGKYSVSKERSESAKKVADIRAEAKKLIKENVAPSKTIQSEIDRLNKKADNIEAKLREGVFAKEKESELNPYNNSEWIKADQRVVNAEKKMRDLKRQAFESQKNWYQKSLMWAGRAVRLAVLSGYKVLGKLASAATIGGAVKRIPEQAIGTIYNKVFSSIAKKAPIEGSSMALNSELKWYKEFFNPKKFVRNSWDILKTGTTYLNKKMGKSEYDHVPILYAATDLHQIIKDPVRRATFEASFDNAMRYAAKEGLDVTDPLVIQSIENAAFKRANYEIFQESNALTRKFTAWKNEMEQKGNLGTTAKFVADFFIPISSVPTNIARRVGITSPFGLLKANVDVINAYRKGIENLKPEEADVIMRQLKQGTMGTALWMIGWCGFASFGGLYTKFNPNKQRDDEDLASDKMEVGGVEIPKPTQHALPLEVIQTAATARRLWNKYNEDEDISTFEAIAKAGLGSIGAVAEQIPIIETPVHMIMATQDPYEAKKLGEDIKGRVQPQILKETGIISKDDKRKVAFTEKEMESPVFKNLIESGIEVPKIGTRLSYPVKADNIHPKGIMTTDEYNKFSELVMKYSHDYTNENLSDSYTSSSIQRLKELIKNKSEDPKVQIEITELKKQIKSTLQSAHNNAIDMARDELKLYTK